MSARSIFFFVTGLSFVPLLFSTDGLHANVMSNANPPSVTATSTQAAPGRISGEPITGPSTPETPPEPSPLAPLRTPSSGDEVAGPTGAPAVAAGASTGDLGVTAATLAAPAAMPAAPPPDVVDDSRPITGSVFDREDGIDRHPVNSARSITGSTFDREDRVDEHPVP